MQSFKWCVLRCYFGCHELVLCGRTAELVVPWTQRCW